MKIENCKINNSLTKFFVKIYGCQYNEWDASRVDFILKKIGLIQSSEKEADYIFILSCSVRKSAVDRIMGTIKNNRNKKIVLSGCVLKNDKKYYKLHYRNIEFWDANKPEELNKILNINKQFNNFTNRQSDKEVNGSSAYLPIMTGCNNFCSYCVVPYTRGRETSRPINEIIKDFKKLIVAGKKEIILLGQNVNSFKIQNTDNRTRQNIDVISSHSKPPIGWTEKGDKSHHSKNDFSKLLKTLNNISGDFVISFTSNHPKDMTDDIIVTIRNLPKIKKEIHLPLQSGSDKILKEMNRPYTAKQYLKLIEKIKKEIPNVKISTDTIIGFPGETEDDFQMTVDIFKKVGFYQAFNNKYSPRKGTASFKLGDPIPWAEKERRWKILNNLVYKK